VLSCTVNHSFICGGEEPHCCSFLHLLCTSQRTLNLHDRFLGFLNEHAHGNNAPASIGNARTRHPERSHKHRQPHLQRTLEGISIHTSHLQPSDRLFARTLSSSTLPRRHTPAAWEYSANRTPSFMRSKSRPPSAQVECLPAVSKRATRKNPSNKTHESFEVFTTRGKLKVEAKG
jgi:hypothetical protein